jgi:hypothetical protein
LDFIFRIYVLNNSSSLQYIIAMKIRVPPQAIPFMFFVNKVAVGQVLFRVLRFSCVNIVPSSPHTYISLIHHRLYIIILATDSVIDKDTLPLTIY